MPWARESNLSLHKEKDGPTGRQEHRGDGPCRAAGTAFPSYRAFPRAGAGLPHQALSLAQKLIAARIIRVNRLPSALERQPDGDFLLPRITVHYYHFLDAYYASGALHTWYLFNSHSGHTKKLFLLVDETERSASGTRSVTHVTAARPALEPGL